MWVGRLVAAALAVEVAGIAAAAGARPGVGGSTEAEDAGILGEPRVPTEVGVPHNFYFVRARYTDSGIYPSWKDWRTDFPKADLQFLTVFKRLAAVDAFGEGLPIRLDDPELRRSPYLYAVEVGQMDPGDGEPHLGERRCRPAERGISSAES